MRQVDLGARGRYSGLTSPTYLTKTAATRPVPGPRVRSVADLLEASSGVFADPSCGTGATLAALVPDGFTYGLELDPHRVHAAQQQPTAVLPAAFEEPLIAASGGRLGRAVPRVVRGHSTRAAAALQQVLAALTVDTFRAGSCWGGRLWNDARPPLSETTPYPTPH